jgi:hypothetical protein
MAPHSGRIPQKKDQKAAKKDTDTEPKSML